jgi:uncharacterized membrane protein YsdA (DUF1294 family)
MSYRSRRYSQRQGTVLSYLVPAFAIHALLFSLLTTSLEGNLLALWWLSLSLISFPLMGWDKYCARRGSPRVPEVVFYVLTLSGGFAGTWLGMVVFRHKTLKPGFWATVVLAAILHLGLAYFWPRGIG